MQKNFYRKILKNGMTVIFEKRELPVVSVVFAVRSGGVNETSEQKGISHFIEHLLYKGTPTRNAKQIAEEIEKNGGELNGFTDELVTAYWCKMPSKHLGVALEVLSDMVKNPVFDKGEIDKERKVIFEEIKMRRDNPIVYSIDKVQECLYKEPLGIPLIGDTQTMSSLNREKIVGWFNKTYSPNNLILGVVGDADFKDIVQFAEKNFGIKKSKISELKISKQLSSKIENRKGIDQASLIFCYHSPLFSEKNSTASRVLLTLMTGGMSSRLFSEIREKKNLAYAIKGDMESNNYFAHSLVYVGTTKENVSEVKKLILEEFKKVSEEIDEDELNQIKEQMIGNYQISMEDSQNQMMNLLMHELNGNAEEFYEVEKNILNVKLEEVKELAKKVLKEHSFFVLEPK